MGTASDAEYRKAYSRGYQAGVQNRWPEHRLPKPPHKLACALFEAMEELADAVDGELGTFDPHDALVLRLGPKLEEARRAAIRVSAWLRLGDSE